MKAAIERTLQILLALVALVLLAAGSFREHKVYTDPKQEYGVRDFIEIGEYQLVEDATFSGTIILRGELYSTYDRTAPKGKMACPT